MDEDMVRADARFQRQAVVLLVVAAAALAAGIAWGLPWLETARH